MKVRAGGHLAIFAVAGRPARDHHGIAISCLSLSGQAAGKADWLVDWIVMIQSTIDSLFIANIHESILVLRHILRIRRARLRSTIGSRCAWRCGLLVHDQGGCCTE
jgi:hypothetical protein